jgi:hypothetical protein
MAYDTNSCPETAAKDVGELVTEVLVGELVVRELINGKFVMGALVKKLVMGELVNCPCPCAPTLSSPLNPVQVGESD